MPFSGFKAESFPWHLMAGINYLIYQSKDNTSINEERYMDQMLFLERCAYHHFIHFNDSNVEFTRKNAVLFMLLNAN